MKRGSSDLSQARCHTNQCRLAGVPPHRTSNVTGWWRRAPSCQVMCFRWQCTIQQSGPPLELARQFLARDAADVGRPEQFDVCGRRRSIVRVDGSPALHRARCYCESGSVVQDTTVPSPFAPSVP